jgi:hypothetical protein
MHYCTLWRIALLADSNVDGDGGAYMYALPYADQPQLQLLQNSSS